MKKSILITILLIAGISSIYVFVPADSKKEGNYLFTSPQKGTFHQRIFASGELKAKKSTKIRGPQGMRSAGIWQTSIKDLITEGTYVKKGDYVGSLDKTELATKIQEVTMEIEKEQTKLEQIKIDTAIQMKEVRDQMSDVMFDMNQEKLEIEKNIYEPEMVIEQSRLKLEKSEHQLEQLKTKVGLLKIQSNAKVLEIITILKQQNSKLQLMMDLSNKFSIMAPEDGMLIYSRTWNGKKGPGSQISSWDPVVAELPDLTKMTSIAYVNEVDISKVVMGQKVKVSLDAYPDKSFDGQIIKVANIGQELKNQDAKVFEIVIEVNEEDDIMKPAMTTSNDILIYTFEDVISVPLEVFYSDSIDYVFKKVNGKIVKQEVISGPFNEDHIILVAGIEEDDNIVLSIVEVSKCEFITLAKDVREKAITLLNQWKSDKEAYDDFNEKSVVVEDLSNDDIGGSGIIFIN